MGRQVRGMATTRILGHVHLDRSFHTAHKSVDRRIIWLSNWTADESARQSTLTSRPRATPLASYRDSVVETSSPSSADNSSFGRAGLNKQTSFIVSGESLKIWCRVSAGA
jgi:hypothetical protein